MSNTKAANITWTGAGLSFTGELGSGYAVNFSSSADENTGSPMEVLLGSVAACTAMDIVNILQKMRQPLTGLRVEISGERAPEEPKVYTRVDIIYHVEGHGIDSKAVERAIALSQETYCSASVMLRRGGVDLHTGYQISERTPTPTD